MCRYPEEGNGLANDESHKAIPIRIRLAVERVDWNRFMAFVVGKTIPFFWIPAHTVTFLLPPEYRVFVAALLSIALGLILALASSRHAKA